MHGHQKCEEQQLQQPRCDAASGHLRARRWGVRSPDTLARYNKMAAAAQSRLRTRHDITEEQKLRQVWEVVLTGFFVAD